MLISTKNFNKINVMLLPKAYREHYTDINQAINTGLYKTDVEVKQIIDDLLNQINISINNKPKKDPGTTENYNTDPGVKLIPVKNIKTDPKRFQNRNKLNNDVLQQIVENYSETKLDPVIVWKDPKGGIYLLAGHHRLEATKKIGKKEIQAKFLKATEKEAIHYAKVESNANRSLETPIERSKIYRELRENGSTKKEILNQAKKVEGKNANYILNLSYLKPTGITISTLESFENADKQNIGLIEKIADWIGEALKNYAVLNYSHEKEMFDFLNDADASKRIKTKAEFLQKITSIVGGFDFDPGDALNLKRFKYETEGEKVYNKEYKEIQEKINKAIEQKADLKDRLNNPENKNYIKPEDKDYNNILETLDLQINKYNEKIKLYQKQLIALQKNKSKYVVSGNNQASLFGSKKHKQKKLGSVVINLEPTPSTPAVDYKGYATASELNDTIQNPQPQTPPQQQETNVIQETKNNQEQKSSKYVQGATTLKNASKHASYFDLNGDLAEFLGKLERKTKHSLVITLDAPPGSGKTRSVFQMLEMVANGNYSSLFVSLEEHPTSKLFTDKLTEYVAPENESKIDTMGDLPPSYNEFIEILKNYDFIAVDSWNKVYEVYGVDFDNDLRKKLDGKLIATIFQRTQNGQMRGGSKAAFDGDIILEVVKDEDFRNSYIQARKNRYQEIPLNTIGYNFYHKKLINPEQEQNQSNSIPATVSI